MKQLLMSINQFEAQRMLEGRRGVLIDTVWVIPSKYSAPLAPDALLWAQQNLDDGIYLGRYSICNDAWSFTKMEAGKVTDIDIDRCREQVHS